MHAFQTLSSFFVHDLKNLASMLSLTVQNLPNNFDNPEFRRDALKVISESVEKMNAMCSRLSLLGRKLDLDRREIDLNDLVRETLGRVNGSLRVPVEAALQPIPRIFVDREQMQKILLNLVLNADDAIEGSGTIRVATAVREGWLVLTVSDTGRGMSEEFIARKLFLPFQTTKSKGLGIGLFQSKRLVEAHGGRIEVDSDEGRGSSFHVLLPLASSSGLASGVGRRLATNGPANQ
jgi:signal transduction histidine kinase